MRNRWIESVKSQTPLIVRHRPRRCNSTMSRLRPNGWDHACRAERNCSFDRLSPQCPATSQVLPKGVPSKGKRIMASRIRCLLPVLAVMICTPAAFGQFRSNYHWRSQETFGRGTYGRTYGGSPIKSYFGFGTNNTFYGRNNSGRGYNRRFQNDFGWGGRYSTGRQGNNFYFNGSGNQYNFRFGR